MLSLSGTNVLIRLPRQDRKHIFPFSMRYTPAIHRTGEFPVSPIIRIPAIAERIQRTNRRRQTAGFADRITPRIITIFYHLRTIRVNQRNHIALQIVDIEVIDAVIGNHAGLALRIVEKYEEENGWYFVWCDDKPAFVLGSDIQFN